MPASPEREVKLGAAPGFHLPGLDGIVDGVVAGPEAEARLETTYFDSADLRLARWGLSLRHRGGEGWTLKLPPTSDGTLISRPELTFPGAARTPPPAALDLVRAFLRSAEPVPVARLSTLRRRVLLRDPGGDELAEVVDDEVSVLAGRRVAARFREVEVELRPGGDAILGPLLARLREAGAGATDLTPKLVRALGPAALRPPDVALAPLPETPTVADVVRHAFAEAVTAILRHDPGIRLGGDPEDVHQARVGCRRLRSHLRTFRPVLDPAWADALRDEAGWLAGELGAVRDPEVLRDRLADRAATLAGADVRAAAALIHLLDVEVEAARRRLTAALASPRYLDLLERLVAACADPPLGEEAAEPALPVLAALVRRPWRDLRRVVTGLPAEPPDQDLHRCRILAKRVRYAAEAVAPAAGREAAGFARAAARLQTVLGEHQDAVVAQAWLREHAGSGRRAFVAGELAALEGARAAAARREWPAAWKRLDRRPLRAWAG